MGWSADVHAGLNDLYSAFSGIRVPDAVTIRLKKGAQAPSRAVFCGDAENKMDWDASPSYGGCGLGGRPARAPVGTRGGECAPRKEVHSHG